jgi:hypothetical protein
MSYWIFKVADQTSYPDIPGMSYVFDNTHSVKVRSGDDFLYLDKTGRNYHITGAGSVVKVTFRQPSKQERRNSRVKRVTTAHLADMMWFQEAFDISTQTKDGRKNRLMTGLPADINTIGWSISIPHLSSDLFLVLLDAALSCQPNEKVISDESQWHIADSFSLVRTRSRLHDFRCAVLERHAYTCVICGTRLLSALDVAHIRSCASDPNNRANPANGICLCRFCHSAFDAGQITLFPDGTMKVFLDLTDAIARAHFDAVTPGVWQKWLEGVNGAFLVDRASAAEQAKVNL